MSLIDALRRKKPQSLPPPETDLDLGQLTSKQDKQMDIPKTLDQALDFTAKQTAAIQGLEFQLKEQTAANESLKANFQRCIDEFGLTRSGDGWESSKLNELSNAVKELTAVREDLSSKLAKADLRIVELLAEQKTVAARAMEFLAAQGGKPLPVSGSGKPQPSGKAQIMEAMDEARRAGDQEAVKRYFAEYQKLKKS